jgi:hypothetical protein
LQFLEQSFLVYFWHSPCLPNVAVVIGVDRLFNVVAVIVVGRMFTVVIDIVAITVGIVGIVAITVGIVGIVATGLSEDGEDFFPFQSRYHSRHIPLHRHINNPHVPSCRATILSL